MLAGAILIAFAAESQTPVVVELFTSQGCSSCPPADELLRKLARDPKLRGKVIPLSFHVDYWNYLGWRDPFSSREWSQRQGAYVRALKLESAYTPQMVVNGTRQLVGSHASGVYKAIEDESKRKPEGSVSVRRDGDHLVVRATSKRTVDVVLVTFENGATTKVERGENKGRTISNDAIVRKLQTLGTVSGTFEQRVPVKLGPRMGVVALLQDRATRRIYAAATTASSRP
jgi:hypothetical protein